MKYLLLTSKDIHPNLEPSLALTRRFLNSYMHHHNQYFIKGTTNLKDKFTHLSELFQSYISTFPTYPNIVKHH